MKDLSFERCIIDTDDGDDDDDDKSNVQFVDRYQYKAYI